MSHHGEPDKLGDATSRSKGFALLVVDRLLEQARERLSLRSGGAPLCSTTSAGVRGGAPLKSLEGAVVALTRLRVSVLDEPTETARAVADRCLQAWKSEHERHHGSAWAGYTDGGARALSDALNVLDQLDLTSGDAPHLPESAGSRLELPPLALPPSTPSRRWSSRRAIVASTLLVVLSTSLLLRSAQASQASVWATVIGLTALVLASAALSTFIPGQGPLRHLHLGCGPCAAVGGLLALGSAWVTIANPGALSTATLSLGAAGFALVQRLTEPPSCPTATPPALPGKPSDTDSTHPSEARNHAH